MNDLYQCVGGGTEGVYYFIVVCLFFLLCFCLFCSHVLSLFF